MLDQFGNRDHGEHMQLDAGQHSVFLRGGGPLLSIPALVAALWPDGPDYDADSDASSPDDCHWTELSLCRRGSEPVRIDVDRLSGDAAVIYQIRATDVAAARRAADLLAIAAGGAVATDLSGPWTVPSVE